MIIDKYKRHDSGFTIVEMMIATAVFSVVLLLCATAAVQVGRMFYKGVTINRVQDTTRKVVEDVSQSIQFGVNSAGSFKRYGTKSFGPGGTPQEVKAESTCLGEVRYSYVRDRSLGSDTSYQARHILWKDRISSVATCEPVDLRNVTPSPNGVELLGDKMRVPFFDIQETPFQAILSWAITITVSYGDKAEVFTDNNYNTCVNQRFGGQFCAVSTINTLAEKRL